MKKLIAQKLQVLSTNQIINVRGGNGGGGDGQEPPQARAATSFFKRFKK
jgi:hypothetical protein